MSLPPLIVRPRAEAFTWYEAQRSGLGTEMLSEVHTVLDRVQEGPNRYPSSLRRAPVRRFPYSIYYVVRRETIVVLAVLHHRRTRCFRKQAWRRVLGSRLRVAQAGTQSYFNKRIVAEVGSRGRE